MKLHNLRKEFDTLEMKQSENVYQYMNHVLAIVNQLKTHGEDMTNQKVIKNFLEP